MIRAPAAQIGATSAALRRPPRRDAEPWMYFYLETFTCRVDFAY
jgi:hypothetical protein